MHWHGIWDTDILHGYYYVNIVDNIKLHRMHIAKS